MWTAAIHRRFCQEIHLRVIRNVSLNQRTLSETPFVSLPSAFKQPSSGPNA